MRILVVDDHPMMADALRTALLTLERAADAHARMESSLHIGKIVLTL